MRRKHLRAWARLRVLCCSGLAPMVLAPDAFALVRQIVPNAAAALFLTAPDGTPQGFFHEDSPESTQRLFLQEPQLFSGPHEYNVFRLVGDPAGAKVGRLMNPPAEHWRSNTYQLLVRASGHHHSLDARLEVQGRRRGLVSLFREPGAGFDEDDRLDMARIALHLEHALQTAAEPDEAAGAPKVEGEAMLVCSPEGRLLFAGGAANDWLAELPLAGADWPDRRCLPPFCQRLIERLRDAHAFPLQLPCTTVATVGGQLQVHAQWLGAVGAVGGMPGAGEHGLVGIVLKRVTPRALQLWRRLAASPLSPQQVEVAWWLAREGSRAAVRERLGVSEAVLRDCTKAVYAEFGCASMPELQARLLAP
jgi:hypothetical protein